LVRIAQLAGADKSKVEKGAKLMDDHVSDELPPGAGTALSEPVYVTLDEAARRSSLSRSTLYHWIRDKKLNKNTGLRKVGSRRMIEWVVFKAAIDAGIFE
jgi:predicted DNA-binding transcriptional regulator AlpA